MNLQEITKRAERWRFGRAMGRPRTNASQAAHDREYLLDHIKWLNSRADFMRAEIGRLELKAVRLEQALRSGGRR